MARKSSSNKNGSRGKRTSQSSSRRRTRRKTTKRSWPNIKLTLDQWLDLAGLVLLLLALLTFLSFLSTQGALTGWWLGLLRTIFGWGVFGVPVGLGAVGLWLILRRFEDKRPRVEPEVVIGLVLGFLTALASLHLFAGIFYEDEPRVLAEAGLGGGYVGLYLDRALRQAVGIWGTVVVLLACWIIAITFSLGISVVELAQSVGRAWAWLRHIAPSRSKRSEEPDLVINTPVAKPGVDERQARQRSATARPAPARAESNAKAPHKETPPPAPAPNTAPVLPRAHIIGGQQAWQLPVLEEVFEAGGEQEISETEIRERAQIIENTLRSFGVPGRVTEVNRGPVITQFGVEPGFVEGRGGKKTKVKVSRISALADDLALALAAPRIRIETPVPGKSIVGIEVPNSEVAIVALRDVIDTDGFSRLRKKSPLPLALGQDVSGSPVMADLTNMPHLLIAGATGSGKSVCINGILACLLSFTTPDQLKMILVDPKRVELVPYNGTPHLLVPVVVDLERVVSTLQWVTREMDGRYRRFAKLGARNITDYNQRIATRPKTAAASATSQEDDKPMPYIVVIIDELADLMMLAPDETERTVCRLAQMARATGIHLIIATQRPSVDVVTGLIKANFPARISFAVASSVDSRVILDQVGAERLLGRGDMLYMSPESGQPLRAQGVKVSDAELQKLVHHWKGVRSAAVAEEAKDATPMVQQPLWEEMRQEIEESKNPEDVLLDNAVEVVHEAGRASISLLQRRLRIGYTRAARLIDLMEDKGIIGPAVGGSYAREVLIDDPD
jgi:S-DNA-T family DNA segregation ATPase FtsK/SpoIIIE